MTVPMTCTMAMPYRDGLGSNGEVVRDSRRRFAAEGRLAPELDASDHCPPAVDPVGDRGCAALRHAELRE